MSEHRQIELQARSDELEEDVEQKTIKRFAKHTANVRIRVENAWQEFFTRLVEAGEKTTPETTANGALKQPAYPASPRRFCYGAALQQSGRRGDVYSTPSPTGWGYICKYCKLEVGNYPAVRLSEKEVLESHTLLTASHLVACRSLEDRKAFYRCLPCYQNRTLVDLSSATALEEHMIEHPEYALKSAEDELTIEVGKRTDRFLPINGTECIKGGVDEKDVDISSEDSGGSDNDDDESVISREDSSLLSEKVGVNNPPHPTIILSSLPSTEEFDSPPSPIEKPDTHRPHPVSPSPSPSFTRNTPLFELGNQDPTETDSWHVPRGDRSSTLLPAELAVNVRSELVAHELPSDPPTRKVTPENPVRRKPPASTQTGPSPNANQRIAPLLPQRPGQKPFQIPSIPSHAPPRPPVENGRTSSPEQVNQASQASSTQTTSTQLDFTQAASTQATFMNTTAQITSNQNVGGNIDGRELWVFEQGKYKRYLGQYMLKEQDQVPFGAWIFNSMSWVDGQGKRRQYKMVLDGEKGVRYS